MVPQQQLRPLAAGWHGDQMGALQCRCCCTGKLRRAAQAPTTCWGTSTSAKVGGAAPLAMVPLPSCRSCCAYYAHLEAHSVLAVGPGTVAWRRYSAGCTVCQSGANTFQWSRMFSACHIWPITVLCSRFVALEHLIPAPVCLSLHVRCCAASELAGAPCPSAPTTSVTTDPCILLYE